MHFDRVPLTYILRCIYLAKCRCNIDVHGDLVTQTRIVPLLKEIDTKEKFLSSCCLMNPWLEYMSSNLCRSNRIFPFNFSLIPDAEVLVVVQDVINEFPPLQVGQVIASLGMFKG